MSAGRPRQSGFLPEIRPEVIRLATRWQEVLTGGALKLGGTWVFLQGGILLHVVGGAMVAGGLGWAVLGLRRMRFRRSSQGAGVVDLLEGQISYLSPHPGRGGFLSIPEIAEITLLAARDSGSTPHPERI